MRAAPKLEELGVLSDLPRRAAVRWPDKAAVMLPDGEVAFTYRALDEAATAFADALRRHGTQKGDRVVISVNNTPGFFVAFFGSLRAGAVALPVDAALSEKDLRFIVDTATPSIVFTDADRAEKLGRIAGGVPTVLIDPATGVWLEPPPAGDVGPPVAIDPDDLAIVLYTSGTTGTPKGVAHSHRTILSRVEIIRSWFEFDDSFRTLCLLPTHFGHGLICNCLTVFHYGGTLIICRPFDIDLVRNLWRVVANLGVNSFSTVPAVVRLLLLADRRKAARATTLRFVTCASAPLRPEEVSSFEQSFGAPLLNCYGITETASWTAFSPKDPSRDPGSVGVAYGCEIRAFDETGQTRPAGEVGEIGIRGPAVMLGYYRQPEQTEKALVNGWFMTGDLGRVDAEGRVFLIARAREVINRAGIKVYPAAVDAALMAHPGIAEAAAFAVEDAIVGETVGAFVVKKVGTQLTENEVIEHCRGQLAPYQVPERLRIVESIPKNSRGKVNRGALAQLLKG